MPVTEPPPAAPLKKTQFEVDAAGLLH